ncbi:3-oxoacyl-ACP synthase III family protein [Streptomyces sp. TR06-5]|uniref:3-oxoacyl-ACP synthase III family protein n=1 Tax=Streptomyces sp. TR06-5 TaxID=3385976 RepID=UPI0039A0E399
MVGTGACVPERVVSNAEVAARCGVSAAWIEARTGVRERHQAAGGEAASDLAAEAVRRAVKDAGISVEDVGLLVLATSTPDELGPSTACRVQALLGAERAVAFDVAAACTGWLFGARVAHDYLAADAVWREGARYAVVVGVEVYSRFLNPSDRATSVLFADGAAATVLGPSSGGFQPIWLGSDGNAAGDVLIPAGGSRRPASQDTLAGLEHTVHMDGRAVRDFILDIFDVAAGEALRRAGLQRSGVDLVVTHQPNPALLRKAAADAGFRDEQVVVTGDEVGNIGAASLPYALTRAVASGRVRPGGRLLLVGFGAGVTWGSTVLTWARDEEVVA